MPAAPTAAPHVRPARPADADSLVALWTAFMAEQAAADARAAPAPDAAARWRAGLSDVFGSGDLALFVAEAGGALVGFAAAERHAPAPVYADVPEVHVDEVYVVPEARRTGAATALFTAVRAWAEGLGARRLRMGVLAANAAGQGLAASWGACPLSVSLTLDLDARPAPRPPRALGFGV